MTIKKVIFWINDTDCILKGEKPKYGIGGANLQLAFWANTFASKGFKVYALTRTRKNNGIIINDVQYIWHPVIRYVGKVVNCFTMIIILSLIKPNLVFSRAKVGELAFLRLLSKFFNFKLVHMLASDDDVMVSMEKGKTKFQKIINKIDYVIAQNQNQKEYYVRSFRNVNIPIIPNIWNKNICLLNVSKTYYDFIWIANITENKRPLWFVNLASQLAQYKFALVGAPYDEYLFNECKHRGSFVPNLYILGYKSFFEVNNLITCSKVLVCTSIVEGFPNTFLQAMSVNVPILSTFDPSDIIKQYHLGSTASNENELKLRAIELMENKEFYVDCKDNIVAYFTKAHSPDVNYEIIKKFIDI